MTTTKDDSKPDAVPEKKPKPVPPIVTDVPKPKGPPKMELPKSPAMEPPKPKNHIQTDDSDQPTTLTTPSPVAGQIDEGDANNSSTTLASPSLPSKKETPSLPFNEKDLMVEKSLGKPNSHVPAVLSDKAVPAVVSDKDLDRQISDKKTAAWLQTQGSEYQVHGKFRPDAASIQGAANKNKISTEIIKAVQTNEYAEVIVRTHLHGQYVDTVVHQHFDNSKQIMLLEMATKHPDTVSGFSSDGMPIFKPDATYEDNSGKKKNVMLSVMHSLLADIQFSIRDAATKASAAGQAKILNQDWRDEDEIESEAHERELVGSLRNH